MAFSRTPTTDVLAAAVDRQTRLRETTAGIPTAGGGGTWVTPDISFDQTGFDGPFARSLEGKQQEAVKRAKQWMTLRRQFDDGSSASVDPAEAGGMA